MFKIEMNYKHHASTYTVHPKVVNFKLFVLLDISLHYTLLILNRRSKSVISCWKTKHD